MNTIRLSTVILILISSVYAASLSAAETTPTYRANDWRIMSIVLKSKSTIKYHGQMLYTPDGTKTGAAFRCEENDLLLFLSAEPNNFMQLRNIKGESAESKITLRINGKKKRTEQWDSVYGGQMYRIADEATISDTFDVLRTGGTIVFSEKGMDKVETTLPAASPKLINEFLETCKPESGYEFEPESD